MSFNHQEIEKSGRATGKKIKHSKQLKIKASANFMRLICFHILQALVFTLATRKDIRQQISFPA